MLGDFAFLFSNAGAFIPVKNVSLCGLSKTGCHKLGFDYILDLFDGGNMGGFKFMSESVNDLIGDALRVVFGVTLLGC